MEKKKATTTPNTVDPSSTVNTIQKELTTPGGVVLNKKSAETLMNEDMATNGSTPNPNTVDNGPGNEKTIDDGINNIKDNQQQIDLKTIEAKKDALNYNKGLENQLGENYQDYVKDTKEYADNQKKLAEDYYNEQNASLTSELKDIQAIQDEQMNTYNQRVNRDTAILNQKKTSEIDYLNAQNEYQRVQNEDAIRQATIDVDIQRQQSAWAYQKLGLGFSSGIINQSQQIATNGIVQIAQIKAKMSLDEATIKTKIADTEFKYTDLVNTTVDKYVDKVDELRIKMEEQINEVNRNVRTNSFDKQKAIGDIEQKIRKELLDADRQHIEDITKVKDKGIEYYESIQTDVENYNKRELSKLDTMLKNGTIVNMSPQEIARKEAELGLPPGTISKELDTGIDTELRAYYNSVLGNGMLTGDFTVLRDKVKDEMRLGKTFTDAIQSVANQDIDTDAGLSAIREERGQAQSLDERKFQLEQKKFELDAQYKAGTLNIDEYKADTDRIKAETDRLDKLGTGDTLGYEFTGLNEKGNSLMNLPDGTDLNTTGREQCGEYFNDITGRKYPMGDTMEDKLKVANTTSVTDGDAVGRGAVWDAGNSVNGHVGVIIGEDEGGYTIKSSNINNDGIVTTDYIEKDKIQGFTPKVFDDVTDLGEERKLLESKAIELGLDRNDITAITNKDLVNYIDTNQVNKTRAKINDATKPLLDRFKKEYDNKDYATKAFNGLIKDGFTTEEALDVLQTQKPNELEVTYDKETGEYTLTDTDYFGDDVILTVK